MSLVDASLMFDIQEVLADLEPRPGGLVRLALLHSFVGEDDKELMAAALLRCHQLRFVRLEPGLDGVAVTAEDRSVAIVVDGRPMHAARRVLR